jgi:hypothetical protein
VLKVRPGEFWFSRRRDGVQSIDLVIVGPIPEEGTILLSELDITGLDETPEGGVNQVYIGSGGFLNPLTQRTKGLFGLIILGIRRERAKGLQQVFGKHPVNQPHPVMAGHS